MDRVEKIAVLDNEVEAQLIASFLSDQNIPHVIRSYHDSAYDGLFQGAGAWGHIEAPQSFQTNITRVLEEIRRQSRSSDSERGGRKEDRT